MLGVFSLLGEVNVAAQFGGFLGAALFFIHIKTINLGDGLK
jgi:hypothetical protein